MKIFVIYLCTIATLMFLQNNTSQKILSIPARTLYPGVVFKVCIYLIVAIVTSSQCWVSFQTEIHDKKSTRQDILSRDSASSQPSPHFSWEPSNCNLIPCREVKSIVRVTLAGWWSAFPLFLSDKVRWSKNESSHGLASSTVRVLSSNLNYPHKQASIRIRYDKNKKNKK